MTPEPMSLNSASRRPAHRSPTGAKPADGNAGARMCARPGCTETATVSFNFDGLRRIVWLNALTEAAAQSAGSLCNRHAGRMTPPRNWELRDTRRAAPAEIDVTTPMLARAFRGVPAIPGARR